MPTLIASGTQAATISTEHTLVTDTSNRNYYCGVDLGAMQLGDVTEIRVYGILLSAGAERLLDYRVFANVQEEKIQRFGPYPENISIKYTLTQTAGTGRSYPWNLLDVLDNVYQAKIWLCDDDTGTTDRYEVVWHKNGQPVTSGITSPTIQVIKASDGTDLIASTAMTQIGATGLYKYDATGASRIVDGAAYIVKIQATIDGATRTWYQPLSRDT